MACSLVANPFAPRRVAAPRSSGGAWRRSTHLPLPAKGTARPLVNSRATVSCLRPPARPECDTSTARSATAAPTLAAALALATNAAPAMAVPAEMYTVADLDPGIAGLLIGVLTPLLSVTQLFFIFRIILTWYPENEDKMPWLLIVKPTEPLLGPTRKVIKPIGGVDVSPVVWFAIFSFINEILIGPQGILRLLSQMRT